MKIVLRLFLSLSITLSAGLKAENVQPDAVGTNWVTVMVRGVNTGNMSNLTVLAALNIGKASLQEDGFSTGVISVHNIKSHVTTSYEWTGGDAYIQGSTWTEYIEGVDIDGPPYDGGDGGGATGPGGGGGGAPGGTWACTRSAAGVHCKYMAW